MARSLIAINAGASIAEIGVRIVGKVGSHLDEIDYLRDWISGYEAKGNAVSAESLGVQPGPD